MSSCLRWRAVSQDFRKLILEEVLGLASSRGVLETSFEGRPRTVKYTESTRNTHSTPKGKGRKENVHWDSTHRKYACTDNICITCKSEAVKGQIWTGGPMINCLRPRTGCVAKQASSLRGRWHGDEQRRCGDCDRRSGKDVHLPADCTSSLQLRVR